MRNYKKLAGFVGTVALLATLAGCSDAVAKLNDSSEVIFSVGNKTVTKGDVFTLMKQNAGATTVINDANKAIAIAEVEVTDEMKQSAQSSLDSYKSLYGDTFASYLKNNNLDEDTYLNDYLIPSLQAQELTKQYIDENFDSIVDTYKPVKATIITFNSQSDADAALADLKGGNTDFVAVAAAHNATTVPSSTLYTSESTDLDGLARTIITSNSKDEDWTESPSSDGSSYFVIKVDEDDASKMKDEVVTAVQTVKQISADATTYFFKKHNFHIYDKTIYDAVKDQYPDNLVQDMK
ncbi:MAG: hypothetical protein MR283_07295 [Erysipelotrichaceae bacterium]|nr:hypothetical protein [Erysipelotrichaceae bacterium]MDY6034076.1 hypothetical protein [Bulleidia sp.]